MSELSSIHEILSDFSQGKMIILVDSEDRENEGDLIFSADFVTAAKINFMITYAKGLVCLAMNHEQISKLNLPALPRKNTNHQSTAFTISIEAAHGVSTGVSAQDRAHTIFVASRPNAKPSDIIWPGHVFPICAKNKGVLERPGHTEAAVDLCNLSKLSPAAVLCEVINDDGTMARLKNLVAFGQKYGIKVGTIQSLIEYRKKDIID